MANPATNPLVACDNVGLTFPGPVQALDGTSFQLQRGELVSVVGPSGCGKSTLLRLIAGLIANTSGSLQIAGQSAMEARRHGLHIGFVFQDATLLPWRTIQDNIRLPLELLRVPRSEHAPRIREALELVGLLDFARALPNQLSGGMRMRAALVRALITRPELLLLDEPFGALDEITRQRLNEDLLALWQSQKWSGVFITHNVYEAVFLSQRVLVMSPRPGKLIADVPIPFEFPRTPELRGTAEFAKLAAEVSSLLRRISS
ncbi:MAG: transporter ATP-binding protein [Planctomycetaceae bacterium]|nr:transporter ATP-binding protein [Planctomycetaceae bacterium]